MNNCHENYMSRPNIATDTHVQIDRLIDLCALWDACHELFCAFADFYASAMQDVEVTKSLDSMIFFYKVEQEERVLGEPLVKFWMKIISRSKTSMIQTTNQRKMKM